MEIIKLPPGERAPEESDCVSIERLDDGRFSLNGSALKSCGDGTEAESVAMIGGEPYRSYDEAEAAGLAWIAEYCAERVFVSTMP